ncbi:hypothetical protein GJ496_003935 [Pomphorhynchus laevis]|nr:hypothetical protein GJ496_003935 [Pomphorhynchus laevis]
MIDIFISVKGIIPTSLLSLVVLASLFENVVTAANTTNLHFDDETNTTSSHNYRLFHSFQPKLNEYTASTNRLVKLRLLIYARIEEEAASVGFSLPYWISTIEQLACPVAICDIAFYHHLAEHKWSPQLVQSLSSKFIGQYNLVNIFTSDISDNVKQGVFFEKRPTMNLETYDFVFALSTDHLIVNNNSIHILLDKNKLIVSPMVNLPAGISSLSNGSPSLFVIPAHQKVTSEQIEKREILGCFIISEISGLPALLDMRNLRLNLQNFDELYNLDLLDHLNSVLYQSNIDRHICNREFYGYQTVEPLRYGWDGSILSDDEFLELKSQVVEHILLEHQLSGPNKTYVDPILKSKSFGTSENKRIEQRRSLYTLQSIDKIYVINLRRRPDRLQRIVYTLETLGLTAQVVEAYDGLAMTLEDLDTMNINVISDYSDPYNKRSINLGEIACSLSHNWIWMDAFTSKYKQILILEDDARFGFLFKYILNSTLNILQSQDISWDLIYLGRKIMDGNEHFVPSVPTLVKPKYSHWTVSYMLSFSGLEKLSQQGFTRNLLPVDEFLPLMYDRQPMAYLKEFYPNWKPLSTFAFQPAIVQPTHYYGESSYISDTENTTIVPVSTTK